MKRRTFVKNISLGSLALGVSLDALLASCESPRESNAFKNKVSQLLQSWCEAMLKSQIIAPNKPEIHGALDCPSCEHIHGRCMDAVYPFLYMADKTGDKKYVEAATLVMNWAENNVAQEDGSWTVIPNPKSWRGITVFGAIALAEALHYHGHVLEESLYNQWKNRLSAAANYVYQTFDLTFTNINYGATAIYGLYLWGHVLNKKEYIERSHELAKGIDQFFTQPNHFLLGEGKPSTKLSKKGLYAIDLGYNVEESLSNLVLYAVETNNEELKNLLMKSLNTHLEFMLPDGAWDNSWGTRQFKWSYWGSRTCDGSQLTYAYMSKHNPAYTKAVIKNTELLDYCTKDGFLHGGPQYIQHGIKPCIHHTFEHAKPLVTLLNNWDKLNLLNQSSLPREANYGIRYFEEIDTLLVAKDDWKGTVTAYDAIYKKGEYRQATGGALSVLYHNKVGLLFAASMAKYKMAEKNNQQPNPGKDFALTPRIETYINKEWFTNIYDLEAKIAGEKEANGAIKCLAKATLKSEAQKMAKDTASDFDISYRFEKGIVTFTASTKQEIKSPTALVLPVVTSKEEKIEQVSDNEIRIIKQAGIVVLRSKTQLSLLPDADQRVFNMVPGVGAIPIFAKIDKKNNNETKVTISITT